MQMITAQGMRMPKLGLGTWPMTGLDCARAVTRAIGLGYRHIDTAENYHNEADVGAGIAASRVARETLHVTSKVWWTNLAPSGLRRACEASLSRLGLEYLDLYLVHWPAPDMDLPGILDVLQRLRDDGKIRALGVSNFPVALLRQAVETCGAPIACNQVEFHVMLDQAKVLRYAREHGIAVTAYSPLAKNLVAESPEMAAIARKHAVSPAQIALKWVLDHEDVAAVPRATRAESQRANLEALALTLDDEDRAIIAQLPKDRRLVNPDRAPAWDPPDT